MRNPEFYKELCQIMGEAQVHLEEPMCSHTTFRTGGPAEIFLTPDQDQLVLVLEQCRMQNEPYLIIGNGSNLLAGDQGLSGVVIEIGKPMSGIRVEGNRVTAQAGALLSSVASRAARAGLSGLEFASGIPGSIGGAVVMNAGAYGGEMKDILEQVTVLTKDGQIRTLKTEELELSYRRSCIETCGYIVLEAVLELQAGDAEDIFSRMRGLTEQRVAKQPLEYPSAGSTFKRPEHHFAGKLIEEAGLRGYRVGDAQVSEKHCGFVINRQNATSADIRQLMQDVQERVEEKFGVKLEPEVKFVGKF